jgi:hypothetical protein
MIQVLVRTRLTAAIWRRLDALKASRGNRGSLRTRRSSVAGTGSRVVVETDPVYHPQKQLHLRTASGAFQESVVIGGPSNNIRGQEFPVHVLAVSKNVSNTFRGYLRDSDTSKRWVGVPKPADSRVLATLKVIRDDSASI